MSKKIKTYPLVSRVMGLAYLFLGAFIFVNTQYIDAQENLVDIGVIGSGPAGLTAGMYGGRAGYCTVVYEGPIPGGQLVNAAIVENWPGVEKKSGQEAVDKLKKQAEKFGAVIISNTVKKVDFGTRPFKLYLSDGSIAKASSVVIASGASPRKLGVPGEDKYWGHGVALCALCDAPLYQDKDTVIVGGGDAAVEQVMLLAPYAKSITMLVRANNLRASDYMQGKIKDMPQLKIVCNAQILEFLGDEKNVNSVVYYDVAKRKKHIISAQGVFVSIGQDPNTQFLDDQLKLNQWGCIKTGACSQSSSILGVFAAGNVADCFYRQAGVACGSGTKAALNARDYLQRCNIKPQLKNRKNSKLNNQRLNNQRLKSKKKEKDMISHNQGEIQMVNEQNYKTAQTLEELNNQLKQDERTKLVYIFSPYCPHCMRMSPIVEQLYEKHKDAIDLIKVDVTKGQEIANDLKISGVPTFIIYKGEEKVDRKSGELPKQELEEFIVSHSQAPQA